MPLAYHHNLIYNDLKDSVEKFSWGSQQTKMALKTALACTTAILIANAVRLDYPFWCGITALVMMRSNVGASFSKGWMRSAGCTLGCILSIFFVGYLVQNPLFFSLYIFIGIFLSFYVGVRAKHGYFWMYMLVNMVLISFISITNPYGTFTLEIAFYRSAEIFLGVVVSWLYNIILWPNFAGNQISDQLNALLSKSMLLHTSLIKLVTTSKINTDNITEEIKDIETRLKKVKSLINDAKTENLIRHDKAEYSMIINILENRLISLNTILADISENCNFIYFKKHNKFFIKLINNFDEISKLDCLEESSLQKKLLNINIFKELLERHYKPHENKDYPVTDILFFYEFIHYIESYYKDLIRISGKNFDNPSLISKKNFDQNSDYITLNFSSYSLNLYKPSLINAVKGGLAVVFTFWFCMWLQVPGGMLNMSVAIIAVFAPQLDTLASKHKGLLRLIGCSIGAAVGLFIILLNIESSVAFFTLIFAFTFLSAYIFGGRPGIAYIGLQGGIAFLLCVAGDFSQVSSIGPVIERLAGIGMAIFFMWIVNFIIWPENLFLSLNTKLSDLHANFIKQVRGLEQFLSPTVSTQGGVSAGIVETTNVNSILNIFEIQQDLPVEIIGNLKMFTMYIRKISEKLYSVSQTSKEVFDFVNAENKLFILTCLDNIISAIEISTEKDREELQKTINRLLKQLDSFTLDIRTKGILRNKEISFKTEVSSLLLTFKRILFDSMQLAKIEIDLELLNECC